MAPGSTTAGTPEGIDPRPVPRSDRRWLRPPAVFMCRCRRGSGADQPCAPPVKFQRGEMEARDEVDGAPAREGERPVRRDAADRPRPERLEERLREPQVRDRPDDPAVLDQPDAVPGQARSRPASADRGSGCTRSRSRGRRAPPPRSAGRPSARRRRWRGSPRARPTRRAALDRVAGARDAGRLRRPAVVEEARASRRRGRGRAATSGVPSMSNAIPRVPGSVTSSRRTIERSNWSSPIAGERAALLDRLAVEPGNEQERQDVRDAVGLEDDLVAAGLEVGRVARRPRLLAARSPTARPSMSRRAATARAGHCHRRWASGRCPSISRCRSAARSGAGRRCSRTRAERPSSSRSLRSRARRRRRRSPAPVRRARPATPPRSPRRNGRRPAPRPARRVPASRDRRAGPGRPPGRCRSPGPRLSSSAGPSIEVEALRPSRATRITTWFISDATFWWMKPVAKRVSASRPWRTVTSTSASRACARDRRQHRAQRSRARRGRRRERSVVGHRSLIPGPRPGSRGTAPGPRDGPCGRSAGAGPCRSSASPRTSTRRGRRACRARPRSAG